MRRPARVRRWIGVVAGGACLAIAVPVASQSHLEPQPARGPAQAAAQPVQQPVQGATSQATPQATSPDTPIFEGPNLRIGVTAVEIDAVVSGKDGRPITDLRAEEFEILQDGRKQTVVSARYIPLGPPRSSATAAPARAANLSAPPPSRMPRPEDVRHTMAIIVDDLNLSFASAARVRHALRLFVERDVHPGDLITIVRSGPGVGRFHPFTSDKRVLLESIERLRYNTLQSMIFDNPDTGGEALTSRDSFQRDVFTAGALGSASFVIRGMREMPGRKSVLLINDGWSPIHYPQSMDGDPFGNDQLPSRAFPTSQPRIMEALQRLVDESNRSFVVIYTLDARGLVAPDLHLNESRMPLPTAFSDENQALQNSQTGPRMLADLAGGLFIGSNNDLAGAMTRVMNDQRGYYLIGYQPDDQTFRREGDEAKFHKVKVRVTRSDAKIRARAGFFGVTDEEIAPTPPATRKDRLMLAMSKPFTATDVGVQATSLFWHNPEQGPSVRALVRVDLRTVAFRPDGHGKSQAPVELAAALIDERGVIEATKSLQVTITASDPLPRGLLESGVVYTVDLPVSQPGPYQLRAAVSDVNADRIGTASEFVIVPKTNGKQLAISGVMLAGAEVELPEDDAPTQATLSHRRFMPGMEVGYTFQVYNARRDEAGKPALASRFRLFRDGEFVMDGELQPVTDTPAQTAATVGNARYAPKNLTLAAGSLKLSDRIRPGAYDLEVAVKDTLAKKGTPAVQWTNFTVSQR